MEKDHLAEKGMEKQLRLKIQIERAFFEEEGWEEGVGVISAQ